MDKLTLLVNDLAAQFVLGGNDRNKIKVDAAQVAAAIGQSKPQQEEEQREWVNILFHLLPEATWTKVVRTNATAAAITALIRTKEGMSGIKFRVWMVGFRANNTPKAAPASQRHEYSLTTARL